MAKILIADDSPTERQIYCDALKILGHQVLTTADGEETERCFYAEEPDLLILDVIMPQKDGYQVCRNIRTRRKYKETPIIMISARNQKSDQYWGLKQGANEYLGKPFDINLLIDKVKQHLA